MTEMLECTLQRLTEGDQGTFGVFAIQELGFSCISLELPPRENRPMISRIPAGNYLCGWNFSQRFKRDTYRLEDVPGRAGILIHAANYGGDTSRGWRSELSGCIALGAKRSAMPPTGTFLQDAVTSSRATVAEFERLTERRRLLIVITDPVLNPHADGNMHNHSLAVPEPCEKGD